MMDLYGETTTSSKSMAVLPQQVVNISQRSMRNVSNIFKASTDNIRVAAFKKIKQKYA